ncbi:PREDICTED: maestro heat-like repeat-containing protein family member 7 [Dipodomys ordii]|uniref:Maestro heat-like repeat-containing protein family member 7 n=1 Tax=Dipodomys ordii TaxID=10020 RepID=A0A1S3F7X2_DIPOR|nr:PREDICTED: maestro heat-like repeat-containing protein family member 7 [Dipodomys ordii]
MCGAQPLRVARSPCRGRSRAAPRGAAAPPGGSRTPGSREPAPEGRCVAVRTEGPGGSEEPDRASGPGVRRRPGRMPTASQGRWALRVWLLFSKIQAAVSDVQMNLPLNKQINFKSPSPQDLLQSSLLGLRQSEIEAYELILQFIDQKDMSQMDKLSFLRAVETLSGAVHSQPNGCMNDYYPQTILTKKIETLILEESTSSLDSNILQQAMLCTVALRFLPTVIFSCQVNPPFNLSQKLDLVNAAISIMFSLPLILPSLDRKESASLYIQIILPWVTLSEKKYEQNRALGTMSRLLRFICNFSELLHMSLFSMTGKLMGILGLLSVHSNHEVSMEASEALHYLFKILVLQRSVKGKIEEILKDLQKHFRRQWLFSMQDLALIPELIANGLVYWHNELKIETPLPLSSFFRKYLTPLERADVIIVAIEAMASTDIQDTRAASKVFKVLLKHTIPEIGKVPEIIQYIYYHMSNITETTSLNAIKKIFHMFAQSYTDEVILTLIKIEDQSQKGVRQPWEILASFPKDYELILEHLLQRLKPPVEEESGRRPELSPLIATRAVHELLLEPSRRLEVQTFFSSLFLALLFRISFLVFEGRAEAMEDQPYETKWVNPISFSTDTLKTLISSSGYGDHVVYIQELGGWERLIDPETHYEGVTLLARSLVVKNCWHNRPIFSLLIRTLQDLDCTSHVTALVLLAELLHCPDVSSNVDDIATHILASWFKSEELATVKVLLQVTETFAKHKNLLRRLGILQPHVLNCCYSSNPDIVMETFLTLQRLLQDLKWQYSSSFLTQLAFMLSTFFEAESQPLRLKAFQIYASLLTKTKRNVLIFPLRHQILNLIVLLVLHMKDENMEVRQICQYSLYKTATILGWSRLKAVFVNHDVFTILRALLQQETNKAPWFLKQCIVLFKSPQTPIRLIAVWFAVFLGFLQLLHCPDVSSNVDDIATHILASWFKSEELATVKVLLQVTETFAKHKNLLRRLGILQPHVLNCCYSSNPDIVMETFLTLQRLLQDLKWQYSSSFLTQLAFMLSTFFEAESQPLRLKAFQIYASLLTKTKRNVLIFPLRHQILNLIVLLVLHMKDENMEVRQVSGQAEGPSLLSPQICQYSLYKTATILGWSRLKAVFVNHDVFTILRALLQQETNKAPWFLKQCIVLFKSPQTPIRLIAVWFAGQIIQVLNQEEVDGIEEEYSSLRLMEKDPDPMVSCLTRQTLYVLEAKDQLLRAQPRGTGILKTQGAQSLERLCCQSSDGGRRGESLNTDLANTESGVLAQHCVEKALGSWGWNTGLSSGRKLHRGPAHETENLGPSV